ncbi:hypothetical protein [Ruegeria sp. YS9]|uniref:hypothetical protein n=1 Tax=Ruegeria sp. YS9 TaxID=2966453 RepID=UPI00214B7562|nr:hypothetical protein [Ruegeria sp. YS9]UUV05941.1 hypothetical protein NOR97_15175 [Ruegeria sp. YS9]
MALVPPPEAIFVELSRSFFGSVMGKREKTRLLRRELSMKQIEKEHRRSCRELCVALEFDESAVRDAEQNIWEVVMSFWQIEQELWTFDAPIQHIVWELLIHLYVPGAARRAAFWMIDDRSDDGLPDGRFWFLPEPDPADPSRLQLPVQQVLNWAFDLIGLSVEGYAVRLAEDQIENGICNPDKDPKAKIARALYRWQQGIALPDQDSIKRTFPDRLAESGDTGPNPKSRLPFSGCWEYDKGEDLEYNYQSARDFIQARNLSIPRLRFDLDISEDALSRALDGHPPEDEKARFTFLVSRRFARPSMKTIRQMLLFARAMQDGYLRLLKLLCPDVQPTCADPRENRVLELTHIFKLVYNLTLEAYRSTAGHETGAQDQHFEAKLKACVPWMVSAFATILPSNFRYPDAARTGICERLSRRFSEIQDGDRLQAYLPGSGDRDEFRKIVEREYRSFKNVVAEFQDHQRHCERLEHQAAVEEIEKETRLWFLNNLAQDTNVPGVIRAASTNRLATIAKGTALEGVWFRDALEAARQKGDRTRVDKLLGEAKELDPSDRWRPVWLHQKARHHINLNEWNQAKTCLKEAIELTRIQSFGPTRGRLSLDLLGLELTKSAYNQRNHGGLVRDVIMFGVVDVPPTDKWVVVTAETHFWEEVYQPYAGTTRRKRTSKQRSQRR